ncbi:ABC transporter ATP-binding protein [Promicromonospora thailandica]|uniref:Sulfonate transport system ATP-binding protein n=1 Tax=Promicromonospora thailandica TaxID=765201 RepID=A0A9X2G8H7_9MICO|nr:ABC transporter ATP-binding protein [Promicromonospora thailandica]MCP2265104.1 sulfonate transport system ATP-binding protein [Promicromonospora thailandica]BFF19830.1 ABC transporter ATP-binding protein [Promicromonospora thailandica]
MVLPTAPPTTPATPAAPADGATALPVRLAGVGRAFTAAGARTASRTVLRGVDLEVAPGEIVAVLGPSGCGKSTLLRQVSGLDAPTSGTVTIDGAPVAGADPRTAVAFQEPRLLPWRTLTQNVALGLPPGTAKGAGRDQVARLLDLVGLAASAGLRPRQVSGGMAQRASLARALARDPGVLLLDEPFGALDALTRLRMQDLLLDVHAARPATVLLVTHDVEEALYLADRVVLLRTLPDGTPSEPADAARSIARVVDVPGDRPRDRAARDLAELRAELLDGLGVPTHHPRAARGA